MSELSSGVPSELMGLMGAGLCNDNRVLLIGLLMNDHGMILLSHLLAFFAAPLA